MELKTLRLRLRSFTPQDVQALHIYASDLYNVKHMDWGPNSFEQTQAFVSNAVASKLQSLESLILLLSLKESSLAMLACG
jgi:RimJ/RimL family protein N-acetyltransferase